MCQILIPRKKLTTTTLSNKNSLLKELKSSVLDKIDKLENKLSNYLELSKKDIAYTKEELILLRNKLQDIYKKQREIIRDDN